MTFADLLRDVARGYPTRTALATALGMELSRLSRAMKPGNAPFDIRGCLRLAQVTGTSPDTILRAAGKSDIADALKTLYGVPRDLYSAKEQDVIRRWRLIETADEEQALSTLLDSCVDDPAPAHVRADQGSTSPVAAPAPSRKLAGHVIPSAVGSSRRRHTG